MTVTLAALVLGLPISGAAGCPSPEEVEARLRPLLPAGESSVTGHRAVLARGPGAVTVELQDASGARLASRRLPAARVSCADLASAAAVIVATWEVELRGRGAVGLWLEAPAPPPPVVLAPERTGAEVALGAGLFGAAVKSSLTGALGVELEAGSRKRALGASLALFGMGSHSTPLAPGATRWQRAGVMLGGRAGLRGERLLADLGLFGVASLLSLEGGGFELNHSDTALDLGVAASPRVGVRVGGALLWAGATLLIWPTARTLEVTGSRVSGVLPRWDILAGLGARFLVNP
jgi:hypothetical protein